MSLFQKDRPAYCHLYLAADVPPFVSGPLLRFTNTTDTTTGGGSVPE